MNNIIEHEPEIRLELAIGDITYGMQCLDLAAIAGWLILHYSLITSQRLENIGKFD
jgi:hypothetical protein